MDFQNKLFDRLEKLDDRLDSIDKILVAQNETLKHHVYRSDLQEDRLDKHEIYTENTIKDVQKQIEPIKQHVNRVDGALKLLGLLSTIIGVTAAIYKFFV